MALADTQVYGNVYEYDDDANVYGNVYQFEAFSVPLCVAASAGPKLDVEAEAKPALHVTTTTAPTLSVDIEVFTCP